MTTLTHATPTSSAFRILVAETARDLFPGYFALVMATGVVSIARHLLGLRLIALPLARLVLFPRRIVEDLSNHQRAPGFFTVVAGTCVLGTQTAVVAGAEGVAACGLALWFVVMYAFLTASRSAHASPRSRPGSAAPG